MLTSSSFEGDNVSKSTDLIYFLKVLLKSYYILSFILF